jgi:hypothetical protein
MNIAYGTGTDPNPICTAYWTSQRFSIGSTTVEAGESLFLLERAENVTSAIPLSSTATAIISDFTRSAYSRYILLGNVSGSGGANSVRCPLHTILPINSVVIGGQGGELYKTAYDCHLITLCRQSDTSEKELDLYISNDEETFTRIQRSTPVGSNTSAVSLSKRSRKRREIEETTVSSASVNRASVNNTSCKRTKYFSLKMPKTLDLQGFSDKLWWRRRGSNSRPYGCEPYALPAELRPHINFNRPLLQTALTPIEYYTAILNPFQYKKYKKLRFVYKRRIWT